MKKKILSLVIAFVMLMVLVPSAMAEENSISVIIKETVQYIRENVTSPSVGSIGGEWAIIGLSRSGIEIDDKYYGNYYKNVEDCVKKCSGVLHEKKYTEYSRLILALTAIGKNPSDVAGYNLLIPLGDFNKTVWQGVNGAAWSLIALDCSNYEIPQNSEAELQATREMYISHLLENQKEDGGWALSKSAERSDADITGMVLQSLAKYTDRADVSAAIDNALAWLSKIQNQSGGFSGAGAATCESSAQVLTAFSMLGVDYEDLRFIKNGQTVLDSLLSYYCGGGFKHTISGEINQMATEQALYALVAAERMKSGKNSIYDMSDSIKISENKNTEEKEEVFITKTFSDIQGHKNQKAVEILCAKNIINGRSETVFDPENKVTRAEFATIIVKALELKNKSTTVFSDVCADDWFYLYVGAAYENGIINGVGNNTFNPYGTITRQEAAVMLSRAAAFLGINVEMDIMTARDILAMYIDYVKAPDWAIKSLAFCVNEGIIKEEGLRLLSAQNAKRGETAQMIYNLLERTGKV